MPFGLPRSVADAAKKAASSLGGAALEAVSPIPNPFEITRTASRAADVFRAVTPQPVRDVAGTTLRAATDAEQLGNVLSENVLGNAPLIGGQFRGRQSGTRLREAVEQTGIPGSATAFRVGLAPATWATAGIGPEAQAGIKSLPTWLRIPANVVAPYSTSPSFAARLGTETAIGAASTGAAEEVARRTDNPLLAGAAGIGAAILTSGAAGTVRRPVPSVERAVVNQQTSAVAEQADSVRALIRSAAEAKPLQQQNRELLTEFRSRQAKAFEQAAGVGEGGFQSGVRALAGQADRNTFEPLRNAIGQEGVDDLFNRLSDANLGTFDTISAGKALGDIMDGVVPTQSELAKLEKAFPGLTNSLRKAKIISGPGVKEYVSDVVSLPQSLSSSLDLSGLRQTATTAYAHPKMFARSFTRSLEAFKSEDSFQQAMSELNSKWYAGLREQAGVSLNASERAIDANEGTAITRVINKYLPGYRPSNRAYTALVNLMRDNLFEDMIRRSGTPPNAIPDSELKRIGRLVNVATGRGSLPKFIEDSQLAGTPIFWAPRLMLSRFEMPFEVLSRSKTVRSEAIKQMTAFVGVNATILGLLDAAGIAEAEKDPRSADFGQIRVGNQRVDPWFGYRPIVNLIARLQTGERKSTTTGAVTDVEAKQVISDFLRQKFSPVTNIAVNLWQGENQIGEPYTWKNVPEDALVSLFLRDLKEAIKNGGIGDVPLALPSVFGFGVNAYEPNIADVGDYEKLSGKPQFNAIPTQSWALVRQSAPEQFSETIAGHDTVSEFMKALTDTWAKQYEPDVRAMYPNLPDGEVKAIARRFAENAANGHPVYKAYLKAKDYYETRWYAENPEEGGKMYAEEMKKSRSERRDIPTGEQLGKIYGNR